MATSKAQIKASMRYREKTYKQINIVLRKGEDADIIKDIESAQAQGISYRDWLRALYDSKEK